ncbi:MAG: hypothetical protein J6G98_04285 [Bacilli bacterium]|nr:hypothetical protein [Bacilli bacterium]
MITYNYNLTGGEELGVWVIISFIAAIVGGIIFYFTFLSKENENAYTGFTKTLYDFLNFNTLTIEGLLKICYLITAIFITLLSFGFITTSFLAFILFITLGNLMMRVLYEFSLLVILIYKNVKEINNKN